MSYEFFIAKRYLKAKRKTGFISLITYISIVGVAVGVAALIIVLSVMNGFEKEVRSRIIGFDAHLRVRTYHNQGMVNYQETMQKIERLDHVVGVCPYIYGKVMIKVGKNVDGMIVKGTDMERITRVSDLGRNLVYGSLKLDSVSVEGSEPTLPGILLGKNLADRLLAFDIGQKVTLISPSGVTNIFTLPSVKQFRLAGIFETGMFEYDDAFGYISIESAQKLMRMGNKVSGLEIRLDDLSHVNSVAQRINSMLGYPYYVLTWFDMHRNLFSWMQLEKWAMFIILSLIIVVAAFNIVSSLIMVVMEKTREIGILKSMGANSRSVMRIFMLEGLVVGGVGAICGSII
ncbi:lipoprotein-releasing system transmembrane subunit LolC, partial [candidate division KSB1 bacterium]